MTDFPELTDEPLHPPTPTPRPTPKATPMDFSHALRMMKHGTWMRRRTWPRRQRVSLHTPEGQDPYLVVKVPFENDPRSLKTIPWIAEVTSADLLAVDWEEIHIQ